MNTTAGQPAFGALDQDARHHITDGHGSGDTHASAAVPKEEQ